MKEVLSHTVKPNRVTQFKIRETITTEKIVTGTKLIKSAEGISALNKYKRQYRENHDTPLVDTKHFKLCTKSKKSIEDCNTPRPRTRRNVTRRRLSNRRNVASPGNMPSQQNGNNEFVSLSNEEKNKTKNGAANNQGNNSVQFFSPNQNNASVANGAANNQDNSVQFFSANQNNAPAAIPDAPAAEPETQPKPKKKNSKQTRKNRPQTRSQTQPVSRRTRYQLRNRK